MNVEETKGRIKAHVTKHLPKYVAAGFGAAIVSTAVITRLVVEGANRVEKPCSEGTSSLTDLNSSVLSVLEPGVLSVPGGPDQALSSSLIFAPMNSRFLGDVSLTTIIKANRKGPPSWLVRCIETNELFSSQRAASQSVGVSTELMSSHLRGKCNDINGLHFERVGMAG